MREALIFKQEYLGLITAQDVLEGKYPRNEEYVDPEYQFRVTFVKSSKNHGSPYFRLYYSLEDYIRLYPERKERHEILKEMRHYSESAWHRGWEEKLSSFCKTEALIKGGDGSYKRADAYYSDKNTVVEFQHSFIANDFEARNNFYRGLGINVVWLYDLSMSEVKRGDDGVFEMLENNAKGFFRIAENPNNLKNHPIFVQVRGGTIYKIDELGRKAIDGENKSTIRFFKPVVVYTEQEFINGIRSLNSVFISTWYAALLMPEKGTVYELWSPDYKRMVIQSDELELTIMICSDGEEMNTDNITGCVTYKYVDWDPVKQMYESKSERFYRLSHEKAKSKTWKLLKAIRKI